MTKNKSLFSGVGDGNRVKSIRLQGDKHTQGKKGEEKNCECGQGGSKPRAPAKLPGLAAGAKAEGGEGGWGREGRCWAARIAESWGPDAKPTAWAVDPSGHQGLAGRGGSSCTEPVPGRSGNFP